MKITTSSIRIAGHHNDCLVISISDTLTGNDTNSLREEVSNSIKTDYEVIYLDAKGVTETDLSGINEVIHSFYTLQNASKKLIFAFKRGSEIEKWVNTTGLHKFIETAISPA